MNSFSKQNKVLILAYDFPPYVSIAGLRPESWALNLRKYGFQPTVITRDWVHQYGDYRDFLLPSTVEEPKVEKTESALIVRTPYRPTLANKILLKNGFTKFTFLRKSLTAILEVTQWFLPVGSRRELYHGAKRILDNNKIDMILVTGEPFILFRYAKLLSQQYNLPWVADYRDPWIGTNPGILMRYLQQNTLKNCSLILTPTAYFKTQIGMFLPHHRIEILANGFNEELIPQIRRIDQTKERLTFSFAGTIKPSYPFFNVLERIEKWAIENRSEIDIWLIGINPNTGLERFLESHPKLQSMVSVTPRLKNKDLLERLRKSNALLLFNEAPRLGTKIYDYLLAERKILLCYSDLNGIASPQREIIEITNAGKPLSDQNELDQELTLLSEEFQKFSRISCSSSRIMDYSREEQTRKLAGYLSELGNNDKAS